MAQLPTFASDPVDLASLYHSMVLTRAFDAKAIALQRTGRFYGSSQEAVAVGAASAMPFYSERERAARTEAVTLVTEGHAHAI